MAEKKYAFPWGIYIGDLLDDHIALPLLLSANKGGFSVIFDEQSESDANNFIENVALKLCEVTSDTGLNMHVFDFSYKKRFAYLSEFKEHDVYHISLTLEDAILDFNKLEKTLLHRYHDLLSSDQKTLSQYNQNTEQKEPYDLLLIHLDHFPEDSSLTKRMKEFFDAAYDAGFYTIVFASEEMIETQPNVVQYFMHRFPAIRFRKTEAIFSETLFSFYESTRQYRFEYVNDNKESIVKDLTKKMQYQSEKIALKEPMTEDV